MRQPKEELRTEVEQLRQRQKSIDRVISALIQRKLSNDTLLRLQGGEHIESISDWIGQTNIDQRLSHPSKMTGQTSDLQNETNTHRITNIRSRVRENSLAEMSRLAAVTFVPPFHNSDGMDTSRGRNSILWPLGEPTTDFAGSWTTVTATRTWYSIC